MPRIVAGWAGSLPLVVPPDGTRPTSDRTREALFSMLEARDAVEGAAVLDLYAGSGALGLEAVSRGAASAVLVERAPRAVRAIESNVATLRRAAPGAFEVTVVRRTVTAYLASASGPFDLVLSDPPYDLPDAAVAGDLAALAPMVSIGGLLVVERAARSAPPVVPNRLAGEGVRRYGDTAVHLFSVG